jgi:DNA-directed RNA polymerase specialized sigma24 family protein
MRLAGIVLPVICVGWWCMSKTIQPEISSPPEPDRLDFNQIESLFRAYGRFAFGIASNQLGTEQAEDIVHEAFLRFWRRPGSKTLKGPAFFGWLLKEVQQLCLERLEK